MSPKLPSITGKEVAAVAKKLGFELDRQKGSHAVYYRSSDKARIVIPMHAGKIIKPKTLIAIIGDMGITIDEFAKLN